MIHRKLCAVFFSQNYFTLSLTHTTFLLDLTAAARKWGQTSGSLLPYNPRLACMAKRATEHFLIIPAIARAKICLDLRRGKKGPLHSSLPFPAAFFSLCMAAAATGSVVPASHTYSARSVRAFSFSQPLFHFLSERERERESFGGKVSATTKGFGSSFQRTHGSGSSSWGWKAATDIGRACCLFPDISFAPPRIE